MCYCEQTSVRLLNVQLGRLQEWLDRLGTLIRSNATVVEGSLMTRLRHVISASAILDGVERNSRSTRTPVAIREWIAAQMQWGRFFFGIDNLSDDQAVEVAGEYMWTDSEDEADEDI